MSLLKPGRGQNQGQTAVPYPTFVSGSKTVTLVATPEALAGSSMISVALVQAKTGNTASVFLGDASGQDVELTPGQAETIMVNDPSKIFVRVAVAAEGVNFHTLV